MAGNWRGQGIPQTHQKSEKPKFNSLLNSHDLFCSTFSNPNPEPSQVLELYTWCAFFGLNYVFSFFVNCFEQKCEVKFLNKQMKYAVEVLPC